MSAMYLMWLATHVYVCFAHVLVEHATKGKKHAENVALRRNLHNIKLKIMLNVYELLFGIFI